MNNERPAVPRPRLVAILPGELIAAGRQGVPLQSLAQRHPAYGAAELAAALAELETRGAARRDGDRCFYAGSYGDPAAMLVAARAHINRHRGYHAEVIDADRLFVEHRGGPWSEPERWVVYVCPPGRRPPVPRPPCTVDVEVVTVHPDGLVDADCVGIPFRWIYHSTPTAVTG
jgi:hypothetical protein